ncbi:MAG TPA: 1-acyl-sn-glycerol-3-phosphate acyltransferase, partial [Candidatus Eisenbacteria bacterium]|nr:1-acyl-sn-glycerol-3-phosphate acyltransferase [Candidatus Eisenbacteria bacterium]
MGIGEAAAALLYRVLRALARVAARVYFRRVDVIRAAPLPAGPLLVAANHPASVTDVVLIALALPRRLHIVARVGLFRPWPRAWVVRALGCLPVVAAGERPDQAETNARTFAAAQALFDAGGALLVFPEGRSESDREVLPLRTGSARLALKVESRAPGRLSLLPVGLRLAERTAFRTEVAVHVGAPLPLAPFAARARDDHEGAVRALTDALHAAL